MDQSNKLLTLNKKIYQIALPVIFGQFGMVLLLLIDSYMVGQVGAAELAAVGLGSTLFLSFSLFGAGCFLTLEAVSAWSKKDKKQSDTWFTSGLVFVFILSLLLTLGQEVLCSPLSLFIKEENLLKLTNDYLEMVKWCLFPYFCFFSLRQFLAGREIVKISTIIIFLSCFVNIFLNWLYIYGNWGVQVQGLVGAAKATIHTRYFMFLSLLLFTLFKHPTILPSSFSFSFENFKKFMVFALPSGFQIVLRSLVFSISGLWMAHYGVAATAAHSVGINMASFLYMVPIGLSTAFAILQAKEKNSSAETKSRLIFAGLSSSLPLMTMVGVGFIFFSDNIIKSFLKEDVANLSRILEIGKTIFFLFPIFQIFDCIQGIVNGSLRGIGNTKSALNWHVISYWIVGLPLSYYLSFIRQMGPLGIWLGLCVGLIMASIGICLSWQRINRGISLSSNR